MIDSRFCFFMGSLMLCLTRICFSSVLVIHNLGVYGTIFPIQEVDIGMMLAKEINKVHWQTVHQHLLDRVMHWGDKLPQNNLLSYHKNCMRFIDPSIRLSKAIVISGSIVHKKGEYINPLKYVRPFSKLLFFDGNDPKQINLARKVFNKYRGQVVLVITQGNPVQLNHHYNIPIYYGFPWLINRFQIHGLPTLLDVGSGKHQYCLALSELAKPYSLNIFDQYWHQSLKDIHLCSL